MSAAPAVAMLALGLGVVAVRRRSLAIALVGAQSLVLGIAALSSAGPRSGELVAAGVVLAVKGVAIPAGLVLLVRRTREPRLVAAAAPALSRLAGAGAVALLAAALVPPLGLAEPRAERIALALVLVGIATVVARRPALFQLLGIIVAENGLSLLAVAAPGGLSYVVELGALFDLALTVTVAAAFAHGIHARLGTGDTDLLRSLRD